MHYNALKSSLKINLKDFIAFCEIVLPGYSPIAHIFFLEFLFLLRLCKCLVYGLDIVESSQIEGFEICCWSTDEFPVAAAVLLLDFVSYFANRHQVSG